MTTPPSTDDNSDFGSLALSQEDVDRLLKDDSPESRSFVLSKVAAQYNHKNLTPSEEAVAEHIFRLLMRDLSLRVRETLASELKDNPEAPRDVILHLASDVEPVSAPVLKDSKVLSDADLLKVVEASDEIGKLVAISQREAVSPRVSSALVETHYAPVLTSLLSNTGAKIATPDLTKIATEFADNGSVIEALAQHPDLPVVVVERIITRASSAVAAELKEKYNLSDQHVGLSAAKVREEYVLRLLEGELQRHAIEPLVMQMAEEGSLTPSILMTALCRGQLAFFIAGMAAIAKLPISNAEQLLSDRGEYGFVGIYEKSGLPESMMEAIRLVLYAVQDLEEEHIAHGTPLYANRLVERVFMAADGQDIDYLPYFIALIRQQRK